MVQVENQNLKGVLTSLLPLQKSDSEKVAWSFFSDTEAILI